MNKVKKKIRMVNLPLNLIRQTIWDVDDAVEHHKAAFDSLHAPSNKWTEFRDAFWEAYDKLNDDSPKSEDGKALNSRPKILEDCVKRIGSIKTQLLDLECGYEEWNDNCNSEATYEKIDKTLDTLRENIGILNEMETELEDLVGELPQGFGRD